MWPSSSQVELTLAVLRRLKWPLIILFYSVLLSWKPFLASVVLSAFMGLTYYAYTIDLQREQASSDNFTGNGLFYRYGTHTSGALWPLPVNPDWNAAGVEQLADSLRQKLAANLRDRLPADSAQVLEPVVINDRVRRVSKTFVRLYSKTPLGSLVVHFFHYATFGRALSLHFDSFVRGTYGPFDVAKFVAASPFSIWLWGLPWLKNEFSVVSHISHVSFNSYDGMDVDTVYVITRDLALHGVHKLLEDEGLLTPELKQMIVNQITNVQSFRISKSAGAVIGSIAQTSTSSVPTPRAA